MATPHTLAAGVVLTALAALASSTLHLGRPLYAFRALSGWRRSWLSREVLFFSLFSAAAVAYALLLWTGSPAGVPAGITATALGLLGVYASARLYMVAARPAWNSQHTILEFCLSAGLTGTLSAALLFPEARRMLALAAAWSAMALAIQQLVKLIRLYSSREPERRATARLLCFRLRSVGVLRHFGLWAIALTLLTQPLPLALLANAARARSTQLHAHPARPSATSKSFSALQRNSAAVRNSFLAGNRPAMRSKNGSASRKAGSATIQG